MCWFCSMIFAGHVVGGSEARHRHRGEWARGEICGKLDAWWATRSQQIEERKQEGLSAFFAKFCDDCLFRACDITLVISASVMVLSLIVSFLRAVWWLSFLFLSWCLAWLLPSCVLCDVRPFCFCCDAWLNCFFRACGVKFVLSNFVVMLGLIACFVRAMWYLSFVTLL